MITTKETKLILKFLHEIEPLKHNLRFTNNPFVQRKDTVGSHTWRALLIALFIEDIVNEPIDGRKVQELLIIHDLVELSVNGTEALGFRDEKKKIKHDNDETLDCFSYLPEKMFAKLSKLWKEFKSQTTLEAKIAKTIERLESNSTAIESVDAIKDSEHRKRTEDYIRSKIGITTGMDTLIESQIEEISKINI